MQMEAVFSTRKLLTTPKNPTPRQVLRCAGVTKDTEWIFNTLMDNTKANRAALRQLEAFFNGWIGLGECSRRPSSLAGALSRANFASQLLRCLLASSLPCQQPCQSASVACTHPQPATTCTAQPPAQPPPPQTPPRLHVPNAGCQVHGVSLFIKDLEKKGEPWIRDTFAAARLLTNTIGDCERVRALVQKHQQQLYHKVRGRCRLLSFQRA